MTTLHQGTTAPPDRYQLEHAREIALAHLEDAGVLPRPGHKTVKVFDTLDPQVLLARVEENAGRGDALTGADHHRDDRLAAGMLLEWAWKLYEDAFTELNKDTVQRHLMFRHEFDELMTDTRQLKFLAFNTDGDLIGMSVYTNKLDAVHLISTDYFDTHHRQEYTAGLVWWVSFVAVSEGNRGMVTFNELIKKMFAQHGPDAITGIDYAKVNVDRGLAIAAMKYLQRICRPLGHEVTCDMVDYQGYHLYTYPKMVEAPA